MAISTIKKPYGVASDSVRLVQVTIEANRLCIYAWDCSNNYYVLRAGSSTRELIVDRYINGEIHEESNRVITIFREEVAA